MDSTQEKATMLTPEQEMASAQEKLAAAKARLELADKLRMQALQVELASIVAAKEKKAAEERAQQEAIQAAWAEKRRQAQEEEQQRAREEAQRIAKIQAEASKIEAAQAEQRKHEATLASMRSETEALERAAEASRLAAMQSLEFAESGVATKEVTPSATEDVCGERHPLARFHQRADIFAPDAPVPTGTDISSEQQSRVQAQSDSLKNIAEFGTTPVYAQRPTTVEAVPQLETKPAKKVHPYIDIGTSRELENLIRRELGISSNTQKCDELSALWEYEPLMSAARTTIAYAKVKPLGHDQFFVCLECTLENPTPTNTPAPVPVKTEAEIRLAVAKAEAEHTEVVASGKVSGGN